MMFFNSLGLVALLLLFSGLQPAFGASTKCHENNSLRALQKWTPNARPFCHSLLAHHRSNSKGKGPKFPSCIAKHSPAQVVKACSCLVSQTARATTTKKKGKPCTKTLAPTTTPWYSVVNPKTSTKSCSTLKRTTKGMATKTSTGVKSGTSRASTVRTGQTSSSRSSTSRASTTPRTTTVTTTSTTSTTASTRSATPDILKDASLTVIESPTSCVKFATATESLIANTFTPNDPSIDFPLISYFTEDSVPVPLIGALVNGTKILIDFTDPSKVIFGFDGGSFYLAEDGLHFFDSDCLAEVYIKGAAIMEFLKSFISEDDLKTLAGVSSRLFRRQNDGQPSTFIIRLNIENECGKALQSGVSPSVTAGVKKCAIGANRPPTPPGWVASCLWDEVSGCGDWWAATFDALFTAPTPSNIMSFIGIFQGLLVAIEALSRWEAVAALAGRGLVILGGPWATAFGVTMIVGALIAGFLASRDSDGMCAANNPLTLSVTAVGRTEVIRELLAVPTEDIYYTMKFQPGNPDNTTNLLKNGNFDIFDCEDSPFLNWTTRDFNITTFSQPSQFLTQSRGVVAQSGFSLTNVKVGSPSRTQCSQMGTVNGFGQCHRMATLSQNLEVPLEPNVPYRLSFYYRVANVTEDPTHFDEEGVWFWGPLQPFRGPNWESCVIFATISGETVTTTWVPFDQYPKDWVNVQVLKSFAVTNARSKLDVNFQCADAYSMDAWVDTFVIEAVPEPE